MLVYFTKLPLMSPYHKQFFYIFLLSSILPHVLYIDTLTLPLCLLNHQSFFVVEPKRWLAKKSYPGDVVRLGGLLVNQSTPVVVGIRGCCTDWVFLQAVDSHTNNLLTQLSVACSMVFSNRLRSASIAAPNTHNHRRALVVQPTSKWTHE